LDLSGWVGVEFGGNCDVCVVSYMLLCLRGGGVVFTGLFVLTSSPYSSEPFCFWRGVGLPPGFCYVSVGLAHLVFYGIENKYMNCRNV